jgi:hypothetical protein
VEQNTLFTARNQVLRDARKSGELPGGSQMHRRRYKSEKDAEFEEYYNNLTECERLELIAEIEEENYERKTCT